jgi:hypothetical protein
MPDGPMCINAPESPAQGYGQSDSNGRTDASWGSDRASTTSQSDQGAVERTEASWGSESSRAKLRELTLGERLLIFALTGRQLDFERHLAHEHNVTLAFGPSLNWGLLSGFAVGYGLYVEPDGGIGAYITDETREGITASISAGPQVTVVPGDHENLKGCVTGTNVSVSYGSVSAGVGVLSSGNGEIAGYSGQAGLGIGIPVEFYESHGCTSVSAPLIGTGEQSEPQSSGASPLSAHQDAICGNLCAPELSTTLASTPAGGGRSAPEGTGAPESAREAVPSGQWGTSAATGGGSDDLHDQQPQGQTGDSNHSLTGNEPTGDESRCAEPADNTCSDAPNDLVGECQPLGEQEHDEPQSQGDAQPQHSQNQGEQQAHSGREQGGQQTNEKQGVGGHHSQSHAPTETEPVGQESRCAEPTDNACSDAPNDRVDECQPSSEVNGQNSGMCGPDATSSPGSISDTQQHTSAPADNASGGGGSGVDTSSNNTSSSPTNTSSSGSDSTSG